MHYYGFRKTTICIAESENKWVNTWKAYWKLSPQENYNLYSATAALRLYSTHYTHARAYAHRPDTINFRFSSAAALKSWNYVSECVYLYTTCFLAASSPLAAFRAATAFKATSFPHFHTWTSCSSATLPFILLFLCNETCFWRMIAIACAPFFNRRFFLRLFFEA